VNGDIGARSGDVDRPTGSIGENDDDALDRCCGEGGRTPWSTGDEGGLDPRVRERLVGGLLGGDAEGPSGGMGELRPPPDGEDAEDDAGAELKLDGRFLESWLLTASTP